MQTREKTHWDHFVLLFSCLALVALLATQAPAQELRGRVQGVVTDVSGAVVVGANVTLRNENTGVETAATTNEVGRYLFDFVIPGAYTLTVELEGFRTFQQQNIRVETRADVTVNASLEVGAVAETVTVTEAPVSVKFTSTTMETTLDTKMSTELPIIHRNPFLLATLDPAVNYRGGTENSPYHHWAASQLDVGGNTSTKNNVLMDGVPQLVGAKGTYVPPMDAVSEVNVQQNATDAEFGHSAGGIVSVQMKGGTNEFHGTAYYFGRNPVLNARPDPLSPQESVVKRSVWGVSSGNPIVRNKVFNYFSYEGQETREPRTATETLPTSLERQGDFSQSFNRNGGIRMIYDPTTTQITGPTSSTREAFPNNQIPLSRIDATSQRILANLWEPNNAGDNITGANNFRLTHPQIFDYYNFSNRTDYQISDQWTVFGRISRFHTTQSDPDFTNGSPLQRKAGSARNTVQASGDAIWTINPTTVFNIRGSWSKITDSFDAPDVEIGREGLEQLWPGNPWYQPYIDALPAIYHPEIDVRADDRGQFGREGFWFQEPSTWNMQAKVSKQSGRHYMKFGGQFRHQRVLASRPRGMYFRFDPNQTADTIFNPNTGAVGHAWASMLLGVPSQGRFQSIPINRPRVDVYGFFFQDDFKISRRVTLNLGLRYEYETPMRDPEDRLSRFLDLNTTLTEIQQAMGPFPDEALALRTTPLAVNGAWVFTDSENRGSWNAQTNNFLPRAGIAIRVNDRTALRFGYARYATPPIQERSALGILGSTPYPGFSARTDVQGLLEGVPRSFLADPFPSSGEFANPLIPARGKTLGPFTTVGTNDSIFFHQDWKAGINDRFNFTVQRETVARFVVDATYFINFGHDQPFNRRPNLFDPRIGFEHQSLINERVDNPFFGLPENIFPGDLRNQRQVTLQQLARPFPHFGDIQERGVGARDERYQSFQLKIQRPFANGFNFLLGYTYLRSRLQTFYDTVDEVDQRFTWQRDSQGRNKLTLAGIYELPYGEGRRWGHDAPGFARTIFGGWSVSGIYIYAGGEFLQFGGLQVNGDPVLDNPSRQARFDTSVFSNLPPFTRRTNPWFFDGVHGPRFANLDLVLAKKTRITEALSFEFRMESYNVTNSFMGNNPTTDVNSGNFGAIVNQLSNHSGREFQYSGRFIW